MNVPRRHACVNEGAGRKVEQDIKAPALTVRPESREKRGHEQKIGAQVKGFDRRPRDTKD